MTARLGRCTRSSMWNKIHTRLFKVEVVLSGIPIFQRRLIVPRQPTHTNRRTSFSWQYDCSRLEIDYAAKQQNFGANEKLFGIHPSCSFEERLYGYQGSAGDTGGYALIFINLKVCIL